MLLFLLACSRLAEAPDSPAEPPLDSGLEDGGDTGDTGTTWPEPECEELVWHEGDLLLESAEDWEAFCAAGFNAVRGALQADEIDLREPCLCAVSGHVEATISSLAGGVPSREGLTQLRSVGSMTVELYDADLPRLERAEGELRVAFVGQAQSELGVVEAGGVFVSGDRVLLSGLERTAALEVWAEELELPALVEVGSLYSRASTQAPRLETAQSVRFHWKDLDAPELHTVGTLRFEYTVPDPTPLSALNSLELLEVDASDNHTQVVWLPEMPALTQAGELDFTGCDEEVFLGLGALERIEGRMRVSQCEGDMSALGLEQVGSLVVREVDKELVFPSSLRVIEDKLVLERNEDTAGLAGLEAVTELGGNLLIVGHDDLGSLAGLAVLARVGGKVEIRDNWSLAQSEAEAFAERLEVEGSVTVEDNWGD